MIPDCICVHHDLATERDACNIRVTTSLTVFASRSQAPELIQWFLSVQTEYVNSLLSAVCPLLVRVPVCRPFAENKEPLCLWLQ